MPEHFDPAWEYWEPDPEIAEVMGVPRPNGFDGLANNHRDDDKGDRIVGFRFGRGNPDTSPLRYAKERFRTERKSAEELRCPTCRRVFQPTRDRRIFCSPECSVRGRPRVVPLTVPCEQCRREIRLKKSRMQRFCSRDCHNAFQRHSVPQAA